ncbi:MAG: DUF4363 family protein [Clostridia bacterium]|nr:DUF4363 family protein [Clostridia bacterium]
MKTFIAALCVFLLLLASVCLNECLAERYLGELLAYAEAIPVEAGENSIDAVAAFETWWQKYYFFLSLTVPHREMERIDAEIPLLLLYAENRSGELPIARRQLIALLDQLREQQEFSLINVF